MMFTTGMHLTTLFKLEAMQVKVLISTSYIIDILLCRCMSSKEVMYVHAVGLHIHVLLHHICIIGKGIIMSD